VWYKNIYPESINRIMRDRPQQPSSQFRISPLIRIPLFTLYIALTAPLPILARVTSSGISPSLLWLAIALGAVILWGSLSERVTLDEEQISVNYASWVFWAKHRHWSLPWSQIQALKPRTTGQGGLVYYFLAKSGDAYLLPMRIAGFAQLVRQVQANTQIDTSKVKPLAQPWMYALLFGFSLLLLGVDIWTIATALQLSHQ
jgi:hypothetical protein